MNFQSMEIDYKTHNNFKKILNKNKYNTLEQYKVIMCPSCIHYRDTDYQDCKICRCIDSVVRCNEYERKKKNERDNSN